MNASPRLNTPRGGDASGPGGASDEGAKAARVTSDYDTLLDYLAASPVRDGDAWLAGLAARAPRLAARVAEVRLAYGSDPGIGCEWDNLRRLAGEEMRAGNLAVLRDWAAGTMARSDGAQ